MATPTSPRARGTTAALLRLAPAAILIATLILTYANSFQGVFVLDDWYSITNNPTIRPPWRITELLFPPWGTVTVTGRPLVNLSLALNFALGGDHPWGYHAFNLAVHILSALVLYASLRHIFALPALPRACAQNRTPLALMATLLWATHPLQTQSVTYVIQRAESLMGLAYLCTLYAVLRGSASPHPHRWYTAAALACALGATAKESIASAPLVIALFDRILLASSWRDVRQRRLGLYAALAASWLLLIALRLTAGPREAESGFGPAAAAPWHYLLTQSAVILHYLRLAFWPSPLCLHYNWPLATSPASVGPQLLVICTLAFGTAWGALKARPWAIPGIWFFLTLAPTSSILPIINTADEHRMYLPLAALSSTVTLVAFTCFSAAFRLQRPTPEHHRRRTQGACLLLLIMTSTLAALTHLRNRDYHSALRLWEATKAARPNNWFAYWNAGCQYLVHEQYNLAIQNFQTVVAMQPDHALAHFNLALAYAALGRHADAIRYFSACTTMQPRPPQLDYLIANSQLTLGHTEQAITDYSRQLRLDPFHTDSLRNRAAAYRLLGDAEKAQADVQSLATAYYNSGNSLSQQKQYQLAIQHYTLAIECNPDNADAYHNRAAALAFLGRLAEAREDVATCQRLGSAPHPDLLKMLGN